MEKSNKKIQKICCLCCLITVPLCIIGLYDIAKMCETRYYTIVPSLVIVVLVSIAIGALFGMLYRKTQINQSRKRISLAVIVFALLAALLEVCFAAPLSYELIGDSLDRGYIWIMFAVFYICASNIEKRYAFIIPYYMISLAIPLFIYWIDVSVFRTPYIDSFMQDTVVNLVLINGIATVLGAYFAVPLIYNESKKTGKWNIDAYWITIAAVMLSCTVVYAIYIFPDTGNSLLCHVWNILFGFFALGSARKQQVVKM